MVDNSKLAYYSVWDIDQLYTSGSMVVSSGDTAIYTLDSVLPAVPVFAVQFDPGTTGKWYNGGTYSTNGALANENAFYAYLLNRVLYVHTGQSGTARYFIWTDKIDN